MTKGDPGYLLLNIGEEILPSYIGIIRNHDKDLYFQEYNGMSCIRVLVTARL